MGMSSSVGSSLSAQSELDALLQNIVTSSAIEGEQLNVGSVRSSLARRLGLEQIETVADAWEEDELFPDWVFKRAGDLGILGAHYPEAHGGDPRRHAPRHRNMAQTRLVTRAQARARAGILFRAARGGRGSSGNGGR